MKERTEPRAYMVMLPTRAAIGLAVDIDHVALLLEAATYLPWDMPVVEVHTPTVTVPAGYMPVYGRTPKEARERASELSNDIVQDETNADDAYDREYMEAVYRLGESLGYSRAQMDEAHEEATDHYREALKSHPFFD